MAQLTESTLKNAGVEPVLHNTRDAKRDEILNQRHSMRIETDLVPDPLPLAQVPRVNRMSRVGTMARGAFVKHMEAASKANSEVQLTIPQNNTGSAAGLNARLKALSLASVEMEGDGACQFRAIADQLFGEQRHHGFVRSVACAHMRAQGDFFGIYFEDAEEFHAYLRDMGRPRTWGDELTLRACVEAFGCVAHVITSESQNWYLMYNVETPPDADRLARACTKAGVPPPKPSKEIFLSYVSPIHYNAIAALSTE